MPPRPIVALFVLFWLATSAWLAYREWWPWLAAEGPPPFVIDLADEAAVQVASWTIYRDGHKMGKAQTRMEPRKDDTFDLVTELRELEIDVAGRKVKVPKLDHVLRVNRAGELVRMTTLVEMEVDLTLLRVPLNARLRAIIVGNELHTHLTLGPSPGAFEQDLDPVPLASRNVISPLMPLQHIRGLTPGRAWRITAVDPLGDALLASLTQTASKLAGKDATGLLSKLHRGHPKELLARVQRDKESLPWEGEDRPCFVIAYKADDLTARTWVRADTAEVLRQEVNDGGQRLTYERDDVKAPIK